MLARLLSGILASVFLPLGIVFAILGGEFASMGTLLLGPGVGLLLLFVFLTQRERRRRARRTAQASAEVLEASINHGVQLNAKRQLTLRVRFPAAGEVSGKFFWYPTIPVGDRIDVRYDPDDPESFEPVDPTGGTGITRA